VVSVNGRGNICLDVKWPGHEVDHSPPSRAKVKKGWSYTSTLPTCLHGIYWDNFPLLFFPNLALHLQLSITCGREETPLCNLTSKKQLLTLWPWN